MSTRPQRLPLLLYLPVAFLLLWPVFPGGASVRGAETAFLRGDADANGSLSLSDAARTLSYLFQGALARPVTCVEALDADDSGSVSVTDAVYSLLHLFSGGRPPPAPYPACGLDTTPDGLGCVSFDRCLEGQPGLDARPTTLGCVAPPRPPSRTGIKLERRFPGLSLVGILGLTQRPGDPGNWYAVRKPGYIYRFANDPSVTKKTTALDLSDRVASTDEGGLLSLAFHPEFEQNGRIFVFYTHQGEKLVGRVARFTSTDGGVTFDKGTEKILLEIEEPTLFHFGGTVTFSKEGYLLVGLGDGGRDEEARNPESLRGKILRLDVDRGNPYAIPPTNPFAEGGGRGEILAWGFRNPFRFSVDRLTGEIWAGDVGKDDYEEVTRVLPGADHGWPILEGTHCYERSTCDATGLVAPVLDYSHQSDGSCVIGGFVYRGTRMPAFQGTYVYGDWGNGRVWGIPPGERAAQILAETGGRVLSFGEDLAGEIYLLTGDKVFQLVADTSVPPPDVEFPDLLSKTGLFEPASPGKLKPCFVPYELNAPFWSDGAEKERWMMVPDGKRVHVMADGDWDFPIGTVLVKQFRRGGRLFETRLLVRHEDGDWGGYSYEWNEAGTDAELLAAEKSRDVSGLPWTFPNRAQCLQCHTVAAGRSLGPETAQLNRETRYPSTGRTANQLLTLEAVGYFDAPLPAKPIDLPRLASPADASLPIEARARAYLHTNCSQCHRPEGGGRGAGDFRFTTSAESLGVCNTFPVAGDLGVAGARLLVPGAPERSLISLRMHGTQGKMPPLGRNVVDPVGVDVIDAWIRSTTECAGEADGVIVDDGGAGTSFTGSWTLSGAPNPFGGRSLYSRVEGTYTFRAGLPRAGTYEVYLWWTEWPSRLASVPVDVVHSGGRHATTIDQRSGGGKWALLGAWSFSDTAEVTIHSLGEGSTCADAVRFVPVK